MPTNPATADTIDELCGVLTDEQWHLPLAAGEWTAAQIIGHLLDVDIVYGFRWRLVLTQENPSYPGYNEKLWSELPRPRPAEMLAALRGMRAANIALLNGIEAREVAATRRPIHGRAKLAFAVAQHV